MNDLIIYGCGSVGRMVEQIIYDINNESPKWNLLGFIDDDQRKHGTVIAGYPVFGGVEQLKKYDAAFVAVGFSNPRQKQSVAQRLADIGVDNIAALVHPRAWVSRRVKIGRGSIIYSGVHVDVDVIIGAYVLLNKLCTVGHDTCIGNFFTAAPGVNLGGNSRFGSAVEMGINSSTIQGVSVGKGSVIGAGSVILRDIPANTIAYGIPAKVIRRTEVDF